MFFPARGYTAIRTLLLFVTLQGVVAACDATSPVGPDGLGPPDPSFAAVPSGLTATAVSWNQIDLSWPRIQSASHYEISRSTTGPTGSYEALVGTTALSHSDLGLTGATQYCYRIRSAKLAGRKYVYSGYSNTACATTPPAPIIPAPSATAVIPQGSWQVRVTWTDNSPDEDGFFIEQAASLTGTWSAVNTAPANATSMFLAANPDELRCSRVVAFIGGRRSLPSAPVCTAAPVWPSGLTATGTATGSINLQWTDNSGVEDGYELQRYTGDSWSVIALPANTTSYADNGVTVDVRHLYRVRATRDGGYGDFSNQATGLAPSAPPAAPTEASAWFYFDEWYGENYFYITWLPGSTNEEGFRIKIPDGAGGWTVYATVEGGSTYYWEYYNYQSGCYQVVAFNALGESAPAEACVAE